MRQIFNSETHERLFRQNGYVVADLLHESSVNELLSFYAASFRTKRPVVPYAQRLPYYISIFDADNAHRREVNDLISTYVERNIRSLMIDYRVFYSNFMIKFPGDGQIEAHQDFNFVDELSHTAFNLWCPLMDTDTQNGGLYVISGSHNVFRTQRGPNLPKALTEHNDMLKKYARWVPLKKGQAIVFDHKLIHYSPPNHTAEARVAIQSVLTPAEAPTIHYVYDAPRSKVKAYKIDKDFILQNNLWDADLSKLELDHEQDLIPFPTPSEMMPNLASLAAGNSRAQSTAAFRRVFRDDEAQKSFERDGFVKLTVLDSEDVKRLNDLFLDSTGGAVANTEYGIYIGLEEKDFARKQAFIQELSGFLVPKLSKHFSNWKPHLGSFLVKAPGINSYTYPHQDWSFVDSPPFVSVTIWIALTDIDESNGNLGFVPGSHLWFEKPVGSPSPDFRTCTQGHEAILYEYLDFVPLKAGEAIAFNNRTIHGATPNMTSSLRTAVAIGMTPMEAQLYHYFLVPGNTNISYRKLAKLKVDQAFFERYSVTALKALFDRGQMPEGCQVEGYLQDEFIPFSGEEIRELCKQAGLRKNGKHLVLTQNAADSSTAATIPERLKSLAVSFKRAVFRA